MLFSAGSRFVLAIDRDGLMGDPFNYYAPSYLLFG